LLPAALPILSSPGIPTAAQRSIRHWVLALVGRLQGELEPHLAEATVVAGDAVASREVTGASWHR